MSLQKIQLFHNFHLLMYLTTFYSTMKELNSLFQAVSLNTYGTGYMQHRTCKQILSKHSCYHQQAHTSLSANARWQIYIACALGRVSTCISCYHTSCCEHLREVNDVKIIASFNFHMIPGIISRDEHVGTFGGGILSNIVILHDNATMENGDVST